MGHIPERTCKSKEKKEEMVEDLLQTCFCNFTMVLEMTFVDLPKNRGLNLQIQNQPSKENNMH